VDKRALKPNKLKLFSKRVKESFKLRKRTNKWRRKNIETIESNIIITCNNGRYFLCIPIKKKIPFFETKENTVALDPGVRTFQTFYSERSAGKIGNGISNYLLGRGKRIDRLQSIIKTEELEKQTKHNLRKRCSLLRTKIKNIINDLHWKTANFLCKTYKNILLPYFNVKGMIEKIPDKVRKISSTTVRNMLTLSHYKFKERLKYMGEVRGNNVIICNEAYTTKTCGSCGNQQEIGGEKIYKCKKCGFELDRDYNGARNIYIKYMG